MGGLVLKLGPKERVLINGAVIETGAPDQIKASAAVRDAYLGHGEAEA